jgi:predicted nucleic acid-binding protein
VILDASVGVEIVRKTPLGQRAIQLLDDNLHAPDIFLAEVFHVLKRMTALRQISARDANISAALVSQMPLTFLTVSNYQSQLWNVATKISSYDAHYVILAQTLGQPIITLDQKLMRRKDLGVEFVVVS